MWIFVIKIARKCWTHPFVLSLTSKDLNAHCLPSNTIRMREKELKFHRTHQSAKSELNYQRIKNFSFTYSLHSSSSDRTKWIAAVEYKKALAIHKKSVLKAISLVEEIIMDKHKVSWGNEEIICMQNCLLKVSRCGKEEEEFKECTQIFFLFLNKHFI